MNLEHLGSTWNLQLSTWNMAKTQRAQGYLTSIDVYVFQVFQVEGQKYTQAFSRECVIASVGAGRHRCSLEKPSVLFRGQLGTGSYKMPKNLMIPTVFPVPGCLFNLEHFGVNLEQPGTLTNQKEAINGTNRDET